MNDGLSAASSWLESQGLPYFVRDIDDGQVIRTAIPTAGGQASVTFFTTHGGKVVHIAAVGCRIPSAPTALSLHCFAASTMFRHSACFSWTTIWTSYFVPHRTSRKSDADPVIELLFASAVAMFSRFLPAVLSVVYANTPDEDAFTIAIQNDRKVA